MTGKDGVTVQCVIRDVTDEKNRRERECENHACAMGPDIVMSDEVKSHAQRDRGQTIQNIQRPAKSADA
jgi:hypothetical protein